MKKFNFSINSFFFLVSVIFIVMIGGLYYQFGKVIKETNTEINKIEINRASALTDKIILHIRNKITGDFSLLFQNRNLREDISGFLSLNVTDEFKYIYVIYKDKNGVYRYLLDGSYGVDKGEFKQKFYPLLENLWAACLRAGRPMYGFQKKVDGLWITYLHPMKIGGDVKAVLVLDISTKEYQNLNKFLIPLYNFLRVFLFVLVAIILVVLMQMYMFYTERKKSIVDPLTRLYNRNYLKEIWNKITLKKIAIMMLDIDHFKLVNDKYGHDIGDIVLGSIAKKMMSETRMEDRVIRYGGEEFLIFLKWPKSDDEVIQIAERIRESIANEKIRINENLSIKASVSIGVNVNPDKSKTLKEAIRVADKMLYLAKNKGRNRAVYTHLDNSE
ncbi:MAG: GGDEF domain-containing protein [Sulfurospirillum sp.]